MKRFLNRQSSYRAWTLITAAALLLPSTALAQVDTGAIQGTVRDSSGAVIPGATITLTSTTMGISFHTTTNDSGNYLFPAVRIGSYTVGAELAGFAPARQEGISLSIQQRFVADFVLVPSDVRETVEVTAESAQLQTQDASLGGVALAQTINDLPLNGRNYTFLAQLTAGVIMGVPDGRQFSSTGAFSANGQDSFSNNYLLDGVDNNSNLSDFMNGSMYAYRPSVDALQEFKVQSSSYTAEFGRAGGAILNASIKSGTEQFHGNWFEFHRNAALDANNFFFNLNNLPKGKFTRNQFGGTLGGPLAFLSRGGRRTFFFTDYEGAIIRQATIYLQNTPTALMQQSNFTDFSELLTQGGTRTDRLGRVFPLGTIFDPATTRSVPNGTVDPITGRPVLGAVGSGASWIRDPIDPTCLAGNAATCLNRIPANRIDQNALRLLKLFPMPLKPGLNQNYPIAPITRDDNHQGDLRIDQYLSQNDTMFYRFSISRNNQVFPAPYGEGSIVDGSQFGGNENQINSTSHAASWTHILSSTMVSEFRFGYTGLRHDRLAFLGKDHSIAQQFGLSTPDHELMGGLPTFTVQGLGGFGIPRWVPTWQTQGTYQGAATLSKLVGDHSLKVAVHYLRPGTEFFQPRAARGAYFYGTTNAGTFTEVPNTSGGATGMAQMLITPITSPLALPECGSNFSRACKSSFVGGPNRIEVDNIPDPVPTNIWSIWSAFIDDSWKVTPKLTLNLGLRYELVRNSDAIDGFGGHFLYEPSPRFVMARDQCDKNLSPSFRQLAAQDGIDIVCHPSNNLVKSPKNMFAPRIGFAYNFADKWVVRAGGGLFYQSSVRANIIRVVQQNYPFSYGVNLVNFDTGTPLQYGDASRATFTSGIVPVRADDPTAFNAFNLSLSGIPSPWKMPRSSQYNLTVQHELSGTQSVSVGYVGSQSWDGELTWNFNDAKEIVPPGQSLRNFQEFKNFSSFSENIRGANSNYNSLQITYDKRVSQGLSLRGNYTLQKCRTQTRQPLVNTVGGNRNMFVLGPDWGLCGWDAPHAMNISGGYDLPVGRGKRFLPNASGVLNQLLGGWRINVIATALSGTPITVPCNIATTTGSGCNAVLTGEPLYPENRSFMNWLNGAAFANPPVATSIGQADVAPLGGPPTQARGPRFRKVDLSIFKNFSINENQRFEFRAEIFNLTNTPNFANPGFTGGVTLPPPPGVLDFSNTSNFGRIVQLRNGQNDQRQIQLALKYYF
jgi:carboxypeptidase family protein